MSDSAKRIKEMTATVLKKIPDIWSPSDVNMKDAGLGHV